MAGTFMPTFNAILQNSGTCLLKCIRLFRQHINASIAYNFNLCASLLVAEPARGSGCVYNVLQANKVT